MRGHSHSELVWVILPAAQNTTTQFAIPDQPLLRYARVTAIEALCREDLATIFPGGTATIAGADLNKVSLILNTNDPDVFQSSNEKAGRFNSTQQNFKYLPLASLHRIQSAANIPFVRQLMEFSNVYPSWDKCYVQVRDGGLGNATDVAVLLNVYYSWLDMNGKPIPRN